MDSVIIFDPKIILDKTKIMNEIVLITGQNELLSNALRKILTTENSKFEFVFSGNTVNLKFKF